MIIVSSISPLHSNNSNQIEAVKSWHPYGECFSLNIPLEIEQIKLVYQDHVKFIKTEKTIKHLVGKHMVSINAIIDFAIKCDRDLAIINSDILIDHLPELRQDGITILSRYNYTDHYGDSKIFDAGFDFMYIPKQFLNVFPISIYALGCSFWDYALPMRFIINKIPVYWPQGKFIYHKLHPTQYSYEEWIFIGQHFQWEFKLNKQMNIGQVATETLYKIKKIAIK